MLSKRDTISPGNSYRWGACDSLGNQLWRRVYSNFDECYEEYVLEMSALRESGLDIPALKWRGVFNLEQAALLVADKTTYADRL